MSDLNDFFAKKDRKKKRAAARAHAPSASAPASSSTLAAASDSAPQQSTQPAQPPPQSHPSASDDGWIEIDDPRGSQVNTGGRTIVEFKRTADEKSGGADGGAMAEKFSGWGKSSPAEGDEDAAEDTAAVAAAAPPAEEPKKRTYAPPGRAAADTSSTTAFPSLADAAKVPTIAPPQRRPVGHSPSTMGSSGLTMGRPSQHGISAASPSRPRFFGDPEKLRKKMAERNAAGAAQQPSATQ